MAPAVREHPEARTKRSKLLINKTLPKALRLRRARALAYEEALHRYSNEMMGDEERMLLLDRIRRLKRSLKAS
jgi:hypothetical protein